MLKKSVFRQKFPNRKIRGGQRYPNVTPALPNVTPTLSQRKFSFMNFFLTSDKSFRDLTALFLLKKTEESADKRDVLNFIHASNYERIFSCLPTAGIF